MPTASGIVLQLPSIASLAWHTLAIALIPLLVLTLVLIVHERRARTLTSEVRRVGDRHWRAEAVRAANGQRDL